MGKKMSMDVINANAAGIDIGSRFHYVAVGQRMEDVKMFGVYTKDHQEMIEWLTSMQIKTIAMESTGSYWQTLFFALQSAGFDVLLVNGAHVKNVKGKKSDVKDCQWIQQLHSLGLLSGSFLPSASVEQLRCYQRLRTWLIEQSSACINKMQKALRLMNIRLDIAVSDITGVSGIAILEAVLAGETDGMKLASLANGRVKKSKEELAAALSGHKKPELLYELRVCYDIYKQHQSQVRECELEMKVLLERLAPAVPCAESIGVPKRKTQYKSNPEFDVATLSRKYLQVDLYAIEGISHGTILSILSEVGTDLWRFKTAKHFTSWLRLAPNNKISGGKVLSSKTPKRKHTLALALRNAANTVGQSTSGVLKSFFSRIAYKKGRAAAVTATARKLAVIIWTMIVKKVSYTPMNNLIYSQKEKQNAISNIEKKMKRLGIEASMLRV